MKKLILLLLIVAAVPCYSSESPRDRKLLRFLHSNKAFLNWQLNWKKMQPRFNLSQMKFDREDSIKPKEISGFSFQILQRQNRLPFLFFCPNGSKAIYPFGFAGLSAHEGGYEIGFDDSNPFLLYDFTNMKCYELIFSGLYGPTFDGIAWLNNNLATIASASWVGDQLENVRPELITIDFKRKLIKRFAGSPVEEKIYFEKRENRMVVEPYLIVKYKP